jgi:UDP-N-acetylglucosamine 2-epimerase (non-hydrolysing)
MKVAPLYHALRRDPDFEPQLVHTGQHYDLNMSEAFFRDLKLPAPAHYLGVGSGTHAEQTGRTMIAYEAVVMRECPEAIVVVGDVNATAACALVGAKQWISVVHLEAGLRSHDRRMPEEINRLVTDAIADLLWTPSPDADANLRAEGAPPAKIECIGNIMIDSFEMLRERITGAGTVERLGLADRAYAVVTLHRPSNVDVPARLHSLVDALLDVTQELDIVFALHPRTRKRLMEFGLLDSLIHHARIHLTEPLGYIEFMNLIMRCRLAITDSGGVQEETTYLQIPCVTLRETTERPITVLQGSNRLLGPDGLKAAAYESLHGLWRRGSCPERWDGHTSGRAVASLRRLLSKGLQVGGSPAPHAPSE